MTPGLKLNPRVRIAPTEYGAAGLGPSGSYFRLNRTAAIVITAMLGGQDADGGSNGSNKNSLRPLPRGPNFQQT